MQSYLDIAKQALRQHRGQDAEGESTGTNYEFNEINIKGRVGDGKAPPLDRPPAAEQELRRLYDYWEEDPEAFTRWLEWAMNYTDPVEDSPCPEDTPSG